MLIYLIEKIISRNLAYLVGRYKIPEEPDRSERRLTATGHRPYEHGRHIIAGAFMSWMEGTLRRGKYIGGKETEAPYFEAITAQTMHAIHS